MRPPSIYYATAAIESDASLLLLRTTTTIRVSSSRGVQRRNGCRSPVPASLARLVEHSAYHLLPPAPHLRRSTVWWLRLTASTQSQHATTPITLIGRFLSCPVRDSGRILHNAE